MMRLMTGFAGILALVTSPAMAQQGNAGGEASGRFHIEGAQIFFDSDYAIGDLPAEIVAEDYDKLRALLRRNPDIETLVLNSGGGSLWAGEEMARLVIDYGLDTHVEGECSSASVTLFLAGKSRSMARGSKIGFHKNTWSASEIKEYYTSWHGHEDGWDNPYEFASWLYDYTQTEAYNHLIYMLERGVTAEFAIEAERPVSQFWYPDRAHLVRGGVLRD